MAATQVFAQKIELGFKAGYNKSIVNGFQTNSEKTGLIGNEVYGGLLAQYDISETFSSEAALLMSWTDVYLFIEVPLFLKIKVIPKGYLMSGVKYNFIPDGSRSADRRGFEIINRSGWSIPVGGQYRFKDKWLAEVTYNFGLTEHINDFALDILRGKRNTLRLGIGYVFN